MNRSFACTLFSILFLFIFSAPAFSQNGPTKINTGYLDKLKKEGRLTGWEKIINPATHPVARQISPAHLQSTITPCDCWIEHDGLWQVVQFDGSGGSGGPGVPPEYRNDDWSTVAIQLPFNFCFYGQQVNEVYINNNGNVSVGAPYSTFTSNTFPDPNFVMIAPFWGDVDTRDTLSGFVWYQLTSSHLIIQWDSVGYFGYHDDLRNTFQLIITDGQDPLLPSGNNVSFCYKDMQWTTGDASGGVGGFGGFPSTVGVNRGNGIDYVQIGQFDTSGIVYNGPFATDGGIDFLDNQSFIFNVCVSGANVPPIVSSLHVCDTIDLCVNDTLNFTIDYLSPEQIQTTTPTIDMQGTSGVTVLNSATGNTATMEVEVIGSAAGPGYHTVILTATDNGTPPQTTNIPVVINVVSGAIAGFTYSPASPVNTGSPVIFSNLSAAAQGYIWDFGDGSQPVITQDTSHVYTADGTYTVTLIALGSGSCVNDTITQTITVISTGIGMVSPTPLPLLVPNPAREKCTLVNCDASKDISIELFDVTGHLISRYDHLGPAA
ncbi:MAG TPA: PKD domain-containing protein, partial [Bacteroidia bacterium]|nr:PKD domain-containing protein [Bacteroidia bacterium]